MATILIHIGGVFSLYHVVTAILTKMTGGFLHPRIGEVFIITIPASIAYLVWLI